MKWMRRILVNVDIFEDTIVMLLFSFIKGKAGRRCQIDEGVKIKGGWRQNRS